MKKFFVIGMMAVMGAIGMSSCQESEAKLDQDIMYKIENREALSADDYSRMINYVGEYAEKAQKYVDMQINGDNLQEAAQGIDKLNEEFPLLTKFRNCIRFTPVSDLSDENLELVGKYAGYVEFSAPSGYVINTAPTDDAGLIEATPETPDGVVAGAVDNMKVEDKPTW